MDMKPLADKVRPHLDGSAEAQVAYVPGRYRGYALEWLDNIRDWALSRQIWWGHRIPAWYCVDCSAEGLEPLSGYGMEEALADGAFRVSVEAGARPLVSPHPPAACPECGGRRIVQDPDVLDTWFSSALWPFATLGWPESTEDLDYFHPTDLMVTDRQILYLWVLRMVMTAVEFVGEIPFRAVLVHPTVFARDGRRMSKSLGTGLNPLDLVRLYGADATRWSLLAQCGSTQDLRVDAEVVDNEVKVSLSAEAGRRFCNKLWNSARYVLMNLDGEAAPPTDAPPEDLADRWIRSRLARTVELVDEAQEAHRFGEVTRALHDFLWRDYCDWYIELAKPRLLSGSPGERAQVRGLLVSVLEQALRLMHPIMPFVTEELWQQLPLQDAPESLMIAAWPAAEASDLDDEAEREMAFLQDVISAARTIRSELNVPRGRQVDLLLSTAGAERAASLERHRGHLEALVGAASLEVGVGLPQPSSSGSAVVADVEIFIPLQGLIDVDAESSRLRKEIEKLQGVVQGLERKLDNEAFLSRAPAAVVEKERLRRQECRASLAKLSASLEMLNT